MVNNLSVEHLKERLLNVVLVVAAIVGSAAYLISLSRLLTVGFQVSFIIDLVVVAAVIGTAIRRRRLQATTKALLIILVVFIYALLDAVTFGLLSAVRVYLILIPILGIIFLSIRHTLLIFLGVIASLLAVGWMHAQGILVLPEDYAPSIYLLRYYPWVINTVHLSAVALIGCAVFHRFFTYYAHLVKSLEAYRDKLELLVKERTEELEATNEEIKATNEELRTTNEELLDQREELEATLGELHGTQQQLVHSEKMALMGVLASGVAHEINNPLNFIHGGTSGLESFIRDHLPEKQAEIAPLIEGIRVGVERVANIVSSLGSYSETLSATPTPLDIHPVIERAIQMLQPRMEGRIEVVRRFAPGPLALHALEVKLLQAFHNILSNAIDAIPGPGEIAIATGTRGRHLFIEFTDNGVGMGPEVMAQATTPFFTTKTPGRGIGLGIPIADRIVQQHRGTMAFRSQPGAGTTVTLLFPLPATPAGSTE